MSKILVAKDANQAKELSRLYREKKIRRIHQGIYTDNLKDAISDVVLSSWMDIVPHIITSGILSFRTALELKPTPFKDGFVVFMTSSYTKNIQLPGLRINISKGNSHSHIEQVLPGVARSNTARLLLENLTTVRSAQYKGIKTIGSDGVEDFLAKELRLRGESILNQIRDETKRVGKELGYIAEQEKLNKIISALLLTHKDEGYLNSKYANAIAIKEPFDSARVKLFQELATYLKKCIFLDRSYEYSKRSFSNLSFFEAYFSNFIEGTEFEIDEAEDIVFKGVEIKNRHADSHDILSNFTLSNDFSEMNTRPRTLNELIDLLKTRHAYMMKERPEKRPGNFKEKPNRAGNTYFVHPNEVIGTLTQGFEIYHLLNEGLEKALFMHFLVSEVHPFDDGNGRLSRIMMNTELVSAGLYKIMIPSVHRDNYLNGLRLTSRDHNFRIYCKAMDQAQAYTASVNWKDYGEAREKIEADHADQTSDEGLPIFNRALRVLKLSEFAV